MSLASLLVHDVTILTADEIPNRYGGTDKTFTTTRTVKGWVSQVSRSEVIDGREARVSEWVLFLHPTETLTGLERVEWEGITFEADGPQNPAWTPRGLHHIEIPLRVVTG